MSIGNTSSSSELTSTFDSISFRMLRRDGFANESSPANSINPNEVAGKPDCFTSSIVLTRRIGTLQDLFSIYPKAESMFRVPSVPQILIKGIQSKEFQMKKGPGAYLISSPRELPGSGREADPHFGSKQSLSPGIGKEQFLTWASSHT